MVRGKSNIHMSISSRYGDNGTYGVTKSDLNHFILVRKQGAASAARYSIPTDFSISPRLTGCLLDKCKQDSTWFGLVK